jgi:hypothetical protein
MQVAAVVVVAPTKEIKMNKQPAAAEHNHVVQMEQAQPVLLDLTIAVMAAVAVAVAAAFTAELDKHKLLLQERVAAATVSAAPQDGQHK